MEVVVKGRVLVVDDDPSLGEMLAQGSREQIDRVTQAFLPMKKMDLAALERAYEGK
jgi:DNA-binding response OmpR family regulator